MSTESSLRRGEILNGRYRVVGLLGKGGLSYVYEVEDTQLPHRWALKEFHPRHLGDEDLLPARALFQKEVEILSRLRHPRLPEIVDSFHHAGRDYIAMELIEGKTLETLIRERDAPFPESTVREWTLQILEILEYLHGEAPPVIYRDIKPQNIIIDEEYGVRFIDFGIARLFNPVKEQDTVFMGTPGFSPPEQFRQRQTDCRSDIYSLGATIHYLLTLQDPGNSPFDFEPISLLNPQVSPLMEKIVQKAVEIKPENRFENAGQMRLAVTGAVPLDEMFRTTRILIEPREIDMAGLSPAGRHAGELHIWSASGDAVSGRLSVEHPGVLLHSEEFLSPDGRVTFRLDNGRFPRGEKVTTAIVFTTEKGKISIPVTVRFSPTFLRGLHPAAASLLMFAVPVALNWLWLLLFADSAMESPLLGGALLLAAAFLIAAATPPRQATRASTTCALLLALLWIPLMRVFANLTDPGTCGIAPDVLSALAFIALHGASCLGLLRIARALTAAQRREMKLVVPVSFFAFPASLYLYPCIMDIRSSTSFILQNPFSFFCAASCISLLFLAALLLSERQGQPPLLTAIPRSLWVFLVCAGFALPWHHFNVLHATLFIVSPFIDGIQSVSPLVRATFLLPASLASSWHLQPALTVSVAAAAAALLFLRFPAQRRAAWLLLFLYFLGCVTMLCLHVEKRPYFTVAAFKKNLARDPEHHLRSLELINAAGVRDPFLDFISHLAAANRAMLKNESHVALQEYEAALDLAQQKAPPVEMKKLRFLVDQARIHDLFDDPRRTSFDDFNEELPWLDGAAPPGFSSRDLRHFSAPGDPQVDESWAVPNSYFSFFSAQGSLRLGSDRDVLLTVLFFQAYRDECKGDIEAAKRKLSRLSRSLASAPRSAVGAELESEAALRRNLPAKSYLDVLSDRYCEKWKNGDLALPLLFREITSLSQNTVTLMGERLDQTYCFKGASAGERYYGRLREMTIDPLTRAYLAVIRERSLGAIAGAYRDLRIIGEERPDLKKDFYYLNNLKDYAAEVGDWRSVIRLLELRRKRWPGEMSSFNYLKWAYAYDMAGEPARARPLYEEYLRRAPASEHDTKQAHIVKNRLAGGPMASFLFAEQTGGGRIRHTFFCEGIPPEDLPPIIVLHRNGETPSMSSSGNVRPRIVHSVSFKGVTQSTIVPEFLDAAKEQVSRAWRFHFSHECRETGFSYHLIAYVESQIFNSWYVRITSQNYIPSEEDERMGLRVVPSDDFWEVLIPRFRFNAPYDTPIALINDFRNITPELEYFDRAVTAEEIVRLFRKKR